MADGDLAPGRVYTMPRYGADTVLAALAALARDNWDIDAEGLLIDPGVRGWAQVYLPERHGVGDGFRKALLAELNRDGAAGRAGAQAHNTDVSGLPRALEGIVAVVAAAAGAGNGSADQTLFLETDADPVARGWLAAAARQGHHARLMLRDDDPGDGAGEAAVLVCEDLDGPGTAESLLARADRPPSLHPFHAHSAGATVLWLPVGHPAPQSGHLRDLGDILNAVARTGAGGDLAWLPDAGEACKARLFLLDPLAEAGPDDGAAAPASDPIQPFTVATVRMRTAPDAEVALSKVLERHAHRLGYRVRLDRVAPGLAADMDLGPLRDRIDALQLQIEQATALGAPQTRLMRFTDAQLPALVDGLRKLPPEVVAGKGASRILYAAGHSAGREEPAHYLLYDAVDVAMRLPEVQWRARTQDRPIAYWLDPFVALAQRDAPTRTQVFVPDGHFLSPSLAHFGGTIETTLRRVLANLFPADAMNGTSATAFLFTAGETGRIEVEMLDRATFAPVRQTLGWMNDYLQVRTAGTVDRDQLAALAAELYQGDYVAEMRRTLDRQRDVVAGEWDAALGQVRADAEGLLDAHASEMEAVAGRIGDAQEYLRQAGAQMRALEALVDSAEMALQGRRQVAAQLRDWDAEMLGARGIFARRVDAEAVRLEAEVSRAAARMEQLRLRIDALIRGGGR